MTKIDMAQKMKDWDMESNWATTTIACGHCGRTKEEAHLTLRSMCLTVLGERLSTEKDLSGEKRIERVELGLKIHGDNNPDLDMDQRVLLRKLILARYPQDLLVYQAHQMLEGEDKKAGAKPEGD